MKPAYYNEYDKYAAEWLCNLIAAGHIAPGVVDTRSIEDVHPADLKDFTQCHFFAGIGVWSLALRRAGWPDDRPVWTGSCPCQPFSAAGQGAGFADERHLWPAFHHLIRQHRPAVVLGEQVASKDADPWIDLVQDDMEGVGYRFGAIPFPSAGVGAPHIRDRLYWVADAHGGAGGKGRAHVRGRADRGDAQSWPGLGGGRVLDGLADAILLKRPGGESGVSDEHAARGRIEGAAAPAGLRGDLPAGPTNGYWRAADWLGCRDGKWRPVEPGTFPLAHGATSRVGRLRAYGNAINAEAARVFIEAVMECQP
ncbi:DNA cytosine methyltransferase [Massilia oculi]|uniref:DNA cytosine methyltransferase n=1 Tax=Massilia oculi TaxID=945844 RepID=UPI001AAEBA7D|nr:DNA cytosine methyltransferase [Massilia oculi]